MTIVWTCDQLPLMRHLIKNLLPYGLVTAVQQKRQTARHAAESERLQRHRNEVIAAYLETHPVRKLQIGCRHHTLQGWLNADLVPRDSEIIFLDATQRFPFEDNSLDYIFTEHMVEHISYEDGQKMFRESLRVLKARGKIRIATPNLEFLTRLHQAPRTDIQQRYLSWYTQKYGPGIQLPEHAFVINNFFRNFGHQFIYDPPTLADALQRAGFSNITRCNVGESEDEHLRGIEQHGQDITDEFNRLETFVLEATKPPR